MTQEAGLLREWRWMERLSCEALGTSAVQGPFVAFRLSPFPSSGTTDSGSSGFMKTKSRKGSVCKSLLLSCLTYTLLLCEGAQSA